MNVLMKLGRTETILHRRNKSPFEEVKLCGSLQQFCQQAVAITRTDVSLKDSFCFRLMHLWLLQGLSVADGLFVESSMPHMTKQDGVRT